MIHDTYVKTGLVQRVPWLGFLHRSVTKSHFCTYTQQAMLSSEDTSSSIPHVLHPPRVFSLELGEGIWSIQRVMREEQ